MGRVQHVPGDRADAAVGQVSILTRPVGRVQPPSFGSSDRPGSFNPHPARGPGATRGATATNLTSTTCFNPHPARGPGATSRGPDPGRIGRCCFNPHPARGPGATCRRVPANPSACVGFNPHPARGPGATRHPPQQGGWTCASFNPHPARGPGATSPDAQHARSQDVSILTRPVGRVQRTSAGLVNRRDRSFNPHPARGPGATSHRQAPPCNRLWCFNPHPARGPGATSGTVSISVSCTNGFQSSPGPWAGCNARVRSPGRPRCRCFNPHPARGPGATSLPGPSTQAPGVSILTRPVGRVQQDLPGVCHRRHPRFNPHPAVGRVQPPFCRR